VHLLKMEQAFLHERIEPVPLVAARPTMPANVVSPFHCFSFRMESMEERTSS